MGIPLSLPGETRSLHLGTFPTKYQSRISRVRALLHGQYENEKCYPSFPYVPYSGSSTPSAEDGLVLKFRALPDKLGTNDLPSEVYWWVDSQFLPYNDSQLITTCTAYIPRARFPWLPVNNMPAGRIVLYNISSSPVSCEHFVRTTTRSYPKVQPHPLGDLVGYVQGGNCNILSLNNECVYSQNKDMMTGACRFMAVAPNGISLALVCRGQGFYFLKVVQMDCLFSKQRQASCHKLCPGFVACRTFTDHVECKWSPDSKFIAVSSSLGQMFVVDVATLTDVTVVCQDTTADNISNAGCFAFDPRFEHHVIAVGSRSSHQVHVVDVVKKTVIASFPEEGCEESIDCVEYNKCGSVLAVAYHNLIINIHNSSDTKHIYTVDMTMTFTTLCTKLPFPQFPSIQRLSFSFSGNLLSASTCDGFVSVWNIPVNFTLAFFCKLKILSTIPVRRVKKLNLPAKVKHYLLS